MFFRRAIYLLIPFIICSLIFVTAGESGGPNLEFAMTAWDFGALQEGAVVSQVFEFKNTGNAELVITDVQTTCGSCTTVSVNNKRILPGQKGEVTVTFDSKNLEGNIWRKVYIITNHKEEPTSTLFIKADVKPGLKPTIELTPKLRDVGFILEGKQAGCKIKISNQGAGELEITKICADDENSYKKLGFKSNNKDLVLPLKIGKGQEKEVEVNFIPNKNSGEYYLNVCFYNNSLRPNYYLNIKATVITRENLLELFTKYRAELGSGK
jgi:hypothetical protein